jgi:hypothetical protein
MVKVTLGEQPAKSEKPFPKLMIADHGEDGYTIIFAEGNDTKNISGQCLFSTYKPERIGEISRDWKASAFTDYNEPITIQNA